MRKIFIALSLLVSLAMQAEVRTGFLNHVALGVNVGTNGVGVELAAPLASFMDLRAGFDYVPKVSFKNKVEYDRPQELNNVPGELLKERYVDIPEYGAKLDVKTTTFLSQGKVLLDIYTGKRSKFHFTVGAMFGNDVIAKLRAADKTIAAVELYNQDIKNGLVKAEPKYPNGINIDFEGYNLGHDKGRVELQAKVKKFRPYVGFGVGRGVPKKHAIGCKFDFGVQFWGTPELHDRYNNDHKITKDEPNLSKDFKDALKIAEKVIVYPTIKFSLFGRIL